MPEPKIKNPKAGKTNMRTAGKTTGGLDDSSGLGFGLLDKISPSTFLKTDILDLIKNINPLSFIIPNLGSASQKGDLKKVAQDMVLKMLYSFACSSCCSFLPLLLIILVILLATGLITDFFAKLLNIL